MQTWLDWYINGYMDAVRRMIAKGGATIQRSIEGVVGKPVDRMTDLDAARFIIQASQQGPEPGTPAPMMPNSTQFGSYQSFNRFILPFVINQSSADKMRSADGIIPGMFLGHALKPSADLVQALTRTEPPRGQAEVLWSELRRTTWYIDFPHRAMMVGNAEVRAVFTQPSSTLDSVAALVVLTAPGSNKTAGRLIWLLGNPNPIDGFSGIFVDHALLREQVEAMIALMILYRKYIGPSQMAAVPRKPAEQMVGRKAQQLKKRYSIFHVENLMPPADRFGRPRIAEERQGWKLGWRSTVAGHFKLQPHGPGSLERKWIWVEAYQRGPADAPEKRPIEPLDL